MMEAAVAPKPISVLNPLAPELNPSEQACLPELFFCRFKFYCLLLEKKSYLIDFSFKFNEIKFCTLLMNWLILEKMFTHFYNTFRPVNRMHYTKYGVNISLLTHFWLLQKVCGTLAHCFITTHIVHNEDDLQIYFGVIFLETRHHAQAHITSGAFIHCALFWPREEHRWQRSLVDDFTGQCFL